MRKYVVSISVVSIFLSLVGLGINLTTPELRGEEPLRLIVSYEMEHFKNYLKPTFLGEIYTHKPPLYNWAIILSSKLFGWSEITIRFLSFLFTALTTALVIIFSYKEFKDLPVSFLSGAIYITFLDIIAYYGWIGEMDSMFTFFVFLLFILVIYGFKKKNNYLLFLAGFYTGFIFLFKGFNAFPFFVLTYVASVVFFNRYKIEVLFTFLISFIFSFIIPLLWFFSLEHFKDYFTDLSGEVVNRVEYNFDFLKFIEHVVTYPIINFKQLFITSAFVLLAFVFYRKRLLKDINFNVLLLIFIVLLNYIPYILLAGGSHMYKVHGRHIMPLFPLLAVIFSYFLYKINYTKIFHIFLVLTVFLSFIRIPYGTEVLAELGKPSRKEIAEKIAKLTNYSKNVSCHKDCKKEKSVCFYYSVLTGSITLSPNVNKNWKYLITCSEKREHQLIDDFKGKFGKIYLYKKGEDLSKSSPEVFQ